MSRVRRGVGRLVPAGTLLWVLLPVLTACGPGRALEELRGEVLFYRWPHGSRLSQDPARVARITGRQVRALREIEDYAGTLQEWKARTDPVAQLRVGTDEFALGTQIFFYYLASLREPAQAVRLELRVLRRSPDGQESLDLVSGVDSEANRRAQSGGLLFSLNGLPPGEHELILEIFDRGRLAAQGSLGVELLPSAGA